MNQAVDAATETRELLRVALDKKATHAHDSMAGVLKTQEFVKLSPSRFVSFVITHFFENYFEKDKELIVSEFFDAKEFIADEMSKVKDPAMVDEVLKMAMNRIQKMQALKKQGAISKRKQALNKPLNNDT